ncbi:MAG TPA: hypothetical protein VE692_00800 [Nitrososphaera sp.]|jgi:hypothetical protein|nr:hypothetical protein [Nitrososphaera sp.]
MLVNNNPNNETADTKEYVTITFRLSRKVIETFRKESEKSGVSINALVNQVLCHYVDWDSFEPRVGMIPFPKAVLSKIFAELDSDQIARLASSVGKDTAIDMAIFMKGRIDILDFISWIETRMRNSGFEVIHRFDSLKEAHMVTIKHDLGKNWSLYLKTMLESILAEFFKKPSEFIVSDSILSVSFRA